MKRVCGYLLLLFLISCGTEESEDRSIMENDVEKDTVQLELVEKEIPFNMLCENLPHLNMDKLRTVMGDDWGEKDVNGDKNNFDHNSKRFKEAYYRGELYNGIVKKCFDEVLSYTVEFKNGVPHGDYLRYNKDGSLESTGEYENGQEHGSWKNYNEFGVLYE